MRLLRAVIVSLAEENTLSQTAGSPNGSVNLIAVEADAWSSCGPKAGNVTPQRATGVGSHVVWSEELT